ncbi:oligosaccharide flippase family protein [Chryseobacterium sp. PTM-20240506]|uniref:oligosaccharide flippase family protein n=1 Tax=unclassified Chryseobacterium TaxID=2593645 RepID=UPI0023581DDE|nr:MULTISPECIES: oligosaccharide flippase family protein [unclassified Chryseobacterium]MDC8105111.1 oligosaccharide flippase family protein [Chryseobacterium sp. B21-037]MDQ1805368.1 oligosaccharide flippase family protein [Chryseobacterium sp. CKR4-1]
MGWISEKILILKSSEINKRIFNNSFWILIGNIVSKLSLLVSTIIMARIMNKEEYGQFGIIKSTILMFAMFAGLELGITATKYISQYKNLDKQKIERIVGLSNFFAISISLIIALLIYFNSTIIASQIAAPQLTREIKMSSFILFFSSINGIQSGILNGLEKFRESAINTTVAGLLSSILLIISTFYFSLYEIIIAFGSNFVFLFILNYYSLKKLFYKDYKIRIFHKDNFKEIKIIWNFSLPAILAGIMVGPVIWICNNILVNQVNGFKEMAIFDIANQWRNTVLFIPVALSQIALPMLTSSLDDKRNYKLIFKKNIKLNLYISLFIVIILVIISPVIVWFYGDKYNDAQVPMIIMFITTGFIAVNNVIGQLIASQGKMWLGLWVNFIWGISLLCGNYLLVMVFNLGAVGISLAYLFSYLVHTLIQFLLIKNFFK